MSYRRPEPPIEPDGAPAWLIILGAALLGLCGGVAVAILLDVLDNTIRDPEQLEHWLGLECLAVVPLDGEWGASLSASTGAGQDHRPMDYRALWRIAAMMRGSEPPESRSLGVTSVLPGDGTTTVVIALGRLMAASGTRVLLIDAVPDNPTLSRWATSAKRPADRPGTPDGSTGNGIVVEPQSGLHVLTVDALARFDASSACPGALSEAVRHALKSYERVIVDMPSLVTGADVRVAAPAFDSVLLVVSCGGTDCELARQALASAGDAQSRLVGAVLNRAEPRVVERYGDERASAHGDGRRRSDVAARASEDAAMAGQTT